MIETIADYRKRYFWKPLLESYSAPHVPVKALTYEDGLQEGIKVGWNAAVAYYKEVGKI